MLFSNKELLQLLAAENRHIVRESAGRFPRDVWVIKTADGKDAEADLGGFAFSPVHVPDAVLQDLERTHLVQSAGRDASGNAVYRAAETGFAQAA